MRKMSRISKALSLIARMVCGERGQVTVLVVAFLPIFILLMGWSIDIGRVLAAKTELAKATDIAAQEVAKEIDLNTAAATGEQRYILANDNVKYWVRENLHGLNGGKLTHVGIEQDLKYVYVESEAEVPLIFSALTGKTSISIKARAIGRLRSIKPR